MNLLQPPARQLGRLAQSRTIHDKFPSFVNHKETPVRIMDGIHPPHSSTHACRECTSNRRKEVSTSRSQEKRPRSHQQGAIPLDKKPPFPTIPRGSEGLVRRNPPPYDTPNHQTKGQTFWTLQNYGSTQRRNIQAGSPTHMENPQRIPRGCPPPI